MDKLTSNDLKVLIYIQNKVSNCLLTPYTCIVRQCRAYIQKDNKEAETSNLLKQKGKENLHKYVEEEKNFICYV